MAKLFEFGLRARPSEEVEYLQVAVVALFACREIALVWAVLLACREHLLLWRERPAHGELRADDASARLDLAPELREVGVGLREPRHIQWLAVCVEQVRWYRLVGVG